MNKQLISEVERGKKKKPWYFPGSLVFLVLLHSSTLGAQRWLEVFLLVNLRGCGSSPSLPYLALGWLSCDLDQAGIHIMLKKCKRDFLN